MATESDRSTSKPLGLVGAAGLGAAATENKDASSVDDGSQAKNAASSRTDLGYLLVRHREGDEAAFGQIVAEYRAPVYGYLVRCGIVEGDRDDLFQEIFVKVHRAAHSFQPERALHPWLFTIVCNTVRTYLRRLKVRQLVVRPSDDTTPELADPGADGERQSTARQRLAHLEAEVQHLSPPQRQVLLLAGVEKLALKEVAVMLQMPVNTVKTHLRRARLALAKALARRDQAPEVVS